MSPKDVAQTVMMAWEAKDANALAACLSESCVCTGFFPQPVEKLSFLDLMKRLTTAFPDWSFHAHVLEEQDETVLFVTRMTGTHLGDLILPTLPPLPPTGQKVSLADKHMIYTVEGDTITAISVDYPVNRLYSPTNVVADILDHLGMELPR